MNKKQLIVACILFIIVLPSTVYAMTFDDMLGHHPSISHHFMGKHKNIKWISHTPFLPKEMEQDEINLPISPDEADYRGQVDTGVVDLDGDGSEETIKVIWGHGVSDHSLTIELYKGDIKLNSIEAPGIQPNFKLEDIDGDKKLELVIWGAVSDPNMSQDGADDSKPFEAHSVPHLFKLEIYKLEKGKYKLSKEYISKKKYEPFCRD